MTEGVNDYDRKQKHDLVCSNCGWAFKFTHSKFIHLIIKT
jgi:hypothetical protein